MRQGRVTMTPNEQQPQREHCEHEFTCIFFRKESRIAWKDGTRCMRNQRGCEICNEDTRTRPHTPAPDESEIRAKILKEVESDEWLEEHDATVARTATLATLDKLQAWRIRRMNGMLKKDVWKGWNEETDFIDSLRRTAQQEHP